MFNGSIDGRQKFRVLIVSHNALSLHANNGKTLYSLFKDWPADNIAQLFFQDEKPESDKFHAFFRLKDIDIFNVLIGIKKKSDCGDIVGSEEYIGNLPVKRSKAKDIVKSLLKDYLHIHTICRDILYSTNLWKSEKLIKWISGYKPNAIFFLGGNSIFSFEIVLWIAEKYNVPFYIYLTDDYVLNTDCDKFTHRIRNKAIIKCYQNSFDKAAGLFVVGELMADEFGKYFKHRFHPIMNSIEFKGSICPGNKGIRDNEIKIIYAGGLHLNRWKMIVEFGRLISKCCRLLNKKAAIEIYSGQTLNEKIKKQLNIAPLSYKGSLMAQEISEKLASADYLLHVESDEKEYRQMTKLSVSTKIPEYLASGTCVIGFGPSEVASMRILADNDIGLTINELDTEEEKINKLMKVISDANLKRQYEQRGFDYAFNHFNASKTRVLLQNILISGDSGQASQ